MVYKLKWKSQAEEEFADRDKAVQKHCLTQFKKLSISPELGELLGKKASRNLTGYRKLYFLQKKYRIVYKLDAKNKEVIIFAIGKREDMKGYRDVAKRIEDKYQ